MDKFDFVGFVEELGGPWLAGAVTVIFVSAIGAIGVVSFGYLKTILWAMGA